MSAKKILIFVLLLGGLFAAVSLALQRQDIRQRAFWYYRPVRPTPASSWSESYRVAETIPLVTDGARQEKPAIWGNKVVWMDWRVRNSALFVYDLERRGETRLGEVLFAWNPEISSEDVVYNEVLNDSLQVYHLASGQIKTIGRGFWAPSIFADKVVWGSWGVDGGSVDMVDLNSNETLSVYSEPEAVIEGARIFGDKVVWHKNSPAVGMGEWIVQYKDLSSGELKTVVPVDGFDHWKPEVSANFIVWQDSRAGRVAIAGPDADRDGKPDFIWYYYDLYGFDLDRQQEFVISQGNVDHLYPRVHDRLVVWQDNRAGNWDIYAYDLATCREFSVASGGHDEVRPAVYGDWVVWEDFRHDYDHTQYNSDIYAARLSLPDLNVTSALVAEPCPSRSAFVVPLPTPTATVAPAATVTPTLTVTPWPTATLTPTISATPPIIAPSLQPTPITALSDLTVTIENLGVWNARTRTITPITALRPARLGEIVVFDVRGRETAGVRVTNSFITRVEFYRGNQLLGSYEYYSAGLYGGSNFAFRVDWSKIPGLGSPTSGISPAGNYRVKVKIDSQATVVERNEVNNEAEREFVVQ